MPHSGLSGHACEWWWDLPSRAHPAWAELLLLCANTAHLEKCLHWPVVLPLYNSVGLCFYSTPPISNLWSELCWDHGAGIFLIQPVLELKLPKVKGQDLCNWNVHKSVPYSLFLSQQLQQKHQLWCISPQVLLCQFPWNLLTPTCHSNACLHFGEPKVPTCMLSVRLCIHSLGH